MVHPPTQKSPPPLPGRTRVRLPSLRLPQLRLPRLRLPGLSRPQLKVPQAPGAPSLSLPRPRRLRPTLPAIGVPSPWPALGRFFNRVASRDFWAPARSDTTGTGRDYTRFGVLLGGFSLMALAMLGVVLIAVLLSGDDSQAPGPASDSPSPSPSLSPTPSPTTRTTTPTPPIGLTDRPWIDAQLLQDNPLAAADILWDTAQATDADELGWAANHIRQAVANGGSLDDGSLCPILDRYNADYSTGQAGDPACSGALVAPPPQGDVSLGIWANELNAWWFGELPDGAATYREGDDAPFLLTWAAEPGAEYTVEITYACGVDGVPAIDILSGVQPADTEIFDAEWGPGGNVPEAAVLLPDTPDLTIDDGSVRLLYMYGGDFLLLPEGPDPAEGCQDERTITVPVRADAGEMILMGSVQLAHSGDHDGQGAADATAVISLSASVGTVGTADAGIEPGVIAP